MTDFSCGAWFGMCMTLFVIAVIRILFVGEDSDG